MTNIAKILENAPRGLKLYSLVHGEVTLKSVNIEDEDYYPIDIIDNIRDDFETLTKYGKIYYENNDAECILFPSKEHKSWDNWQDVLFKVGDIVTNIKNTEQEQKTFIISSKSLNFIATTNSKHELFLQEEPSSYRYATPEEREQFFKELNDNGYTWNEETKQMEKSLQNTPKFKIGDWLYDNDHGVIQITDIIGGNDGLYCFNNECQNLISLTDKFSRLATEQELIDAGIKEKPFTIDDFKPTQFVLVRDWNDEKWNLNIFSYINESGEFVCVSEIYDMCIPYNNETKHLLGTINDCPKKYKTW